MDKYCITLDTVIMVMAVEESIYVEKKSITHTFMTLLIYIKMSYFSQACSHGPLVKFSIQWYRRYCDRNFHYMYHNVLHVLLYYMYYMFKVLKGCICIQTGRDVVRYIFTIRYYKENKYDLFLWWSISSFATCS